MHPAEFYTLVRHNRQRAIRFLLCCDGPELWRLGAACAQYLRDQYGVPVSPEHVLLTWRSVQLIDERQTELALALHTRAVSS